MTEDRRRRWLRRSIEGKIRSAGQIAVLMGRAIRRLPWANRREFLRSLHHFGFDSLPLAVMVATLAGTTLVMQTQVYAQRFGARNYLGWAAGYAVIWEFGPLLLGLMFAARTGARNAAELASLTVGGQLDGLRGIALDPIALLVAPRAAAIVASVVSLACLTFAIAILWEMVAAYFVLKIPARVFLASFSDLITPGVLFGGLVKSTFFAIAVSIVSTVSGVRASGGARGVGQATANAVVWSCASIFLLDFLLTPLLLKVAG